MHTERRRPRRHRRLAATAAAAGAAVALLAAGASPAAAADCGTQAAAQPFIDHLDSAHLERSPMQQVQDIMHTDDYVLAHTVLVESMLKPVLGSCSDATGGAPEPMPAHGSMPAAPPPPAAAPAAAAIGIHDYAYEPATLSIPVGTTVSWTNHDADSHTITGSGLKSKSLAAGETYSFAFMQAGTFTYACALHPQMKGTITVA